MNAEEWYQQGYTKPTARSMVILEPHIESVSGHPRGLSLFPWAVELTEEGAKIASCPVRFICRAKDLHEAARAVLAKTKGEIE